jgi:hypothetical protein
MKRWIVKQFVQISEITGREVPRWIRRLVPDSEFEALQRAESDLTRTLTAARSDREAMPEDLKGRLEDMGRESEPIHVPLQQPFPFFAWGLAAAALLVLGTVLIFRPPAPHQASPEQSPLLVDQAGPTDSAPIDQPTTGDVLHVAEALSGDLLTNPLASEKERLAADVTNAIRYVAESFLPSAYAVPVNESLQSVEQRFIKSI